MARSETVTNGKIHSMPNSDKYRDNYDAIFNSSIDPAEELYEVARIEYETEGLVSVDTLTEMQALGLDISDYT